MASDSFAEVKEITALELGVEGWEWERDSP